MCVYACVGMFYYPAVTYAIALSTLSGKRFLYTFIFHPPKQPFKSFLVIFYAETVFALMKRQIQNMT